MFPGPIKNHHLWQWQQHRNLQDARKSSVYMPKNDESLYHGVTPSFSLLWVSADHVLVKGLGSNRDQFLPRHFSRPSMKLTSRVPQILKVDPDKKDLCHCNRIIIIKSKLERRNRSRSSKAPWFLLYMYSIQTIYLSLSHSIIWRDLLFGLACRLYGWNMQTTRLRKADDTLFRDSIT